MYKAIKFTPDGLEHPGGCKWDTVCIDNIGTWVEISKKSLPNPVKKATTFILNQHNK
jgi:hypothetical protein